MPHDRKAASRIVDAPEPGFFRMALVKGGWRVPCRLHLWRGEVLVATIDGTVVADSVDRIWHGAERINETEYQALLMLKALMRRKNPDHPALHPMRPIDPKTLKPIIPGEGA